MAAPLPPSVSSAGTANTFENLLTNNKILYPPPPSKRRKRFAKIREAIQGKR